MKTIVHLEYNKGDVVSVEAKYSWNQIPKEENRFVVDGYMIVLKQDAEPEVSYIFHCYCNKYIGYHEQINESRLTPLEKNHPHEVEIDVKDIFGNDINFSDQVYSGLYCNSYYGHRNENIITKSMSFISGGIVNKITYGFNDSNRSGIYIFFARNILCTDPDGNEYLDGRRCGSEQCGSVHIICKTVPDTFYKEIVDGATYAEGYLYDKYDAHTFKCLMEIFGQYKQAKEYLEKKLNQQESNREKRRTKCKVKQKEKQSNKLDNIVKDVKDLSDEDKAKLLELLTKSQN